MPFGTVGLYNVYSAMIYENRRNFAKGINWKKNSYYRNNIEQWFNLKILLLKNTLNNINNIIIYTYLIQGVPRNMTAYEQFKMSSSICCIRYWGLFAVSIKKIHINIFYFEINFTIIRLSNTVTKPETNIHWAIHEKTLED